MENKRVLNERQEAVLKAIVISYIHSARPIGSAFVADILNLSSATIRNAMSDLEEMGFINKPHTSAGRIPIANGYRYYVNHLLDFNTVSSKQKKFIEKEYSKLTNSIELILEGVSHLLSAMTRHAAVVCMPNLKLYIEGTSNMLDMPEFKNPARVRILLKLFDDKKELLELLNEDLTVDGVKIHIGDENRFEELRELSVITANYKIRGLKKGNLGIVGPLRMDYSALIPLIDFHSRTIEAVLDELGV